MVPGGTQKNLVCQHSGLQNTHSHVKCFLATNFFQNLRHIRTHPNRWQITPKFVIPIPLGYWTMTTSIRKTNKVYTC